MILRTRFPIWVPIIVVIMTACRTGTAVPSPTPTMTSFPFVTATERPTGTPVTPTQTPTATATIFIPTATITPRLTFTPSFTPSKTPTTVRNPTATVPGVGGVPCTTEPPGRFGTVYRSDPGIANALGCATAPPDSDEPAKTWPITAIYQPFERGYLMWLSAVGWFEGKVIYVLLDDQSYSREDDFYDPLFDPESGNFRPPTGLYEPVEALGKIWREQPGLKDQLGFGTEPQVELETRMMMFEFGEMVLVSPGDRMFIFKRGNPNTWSIFDAP